MNAPNCEIIRGEVSVFRGGAGGLSYFSRGSFRGTLVVGANWPEALASAMSETRQVKKVAFNGLKQIIIWSSCVDSPELHATDDSRQGREEEATSEQEKGFSRFDPVTDSSA